MSHLVLARRYRPQRFDDLIGQEVVVRTLRNALASGETAHAYVFAGLRGVGKTTAARILARALNCHQGPTPDPCGECSACVDIAEGRALDVLEIDAASNRGIDDVRELRETARAMPVRDRFRVFILDEAHQLSRDAWGALLKIIEEPPPHVVFVLASTDKQKFPATILSRCQQLDFRPVPTETLRAHLVEVARAEGFALPDGAALMLAQSAEGSVRDALSLLDRVRAFSPAGVDEAAVAEVLGLPRFEVVLKIWDSLFGGDVAAVLQLLREVEAEGTDPVAVYEALTTFAHTALLLACAPACPIPYAAEQRPALAARAAAAGQLRLVRLLGQLVEHRRLITEADQSRLAVAVALGRLALWPRVRRIEELLAGGAQAVAAGVPASDGQVAAPRLSPEAGGAPGDLRRRLAAALDEAGAHLLAAGVVSASAARVEGGVLYLSYPSAAAANGQAAQEGLAELAAAARAAGIAQEVRVEWSPFAPSSPAPSDELRLKVLAHEGVQRVLEIFGGKLERVEEKV
ncbi:MAG: DNA polymerase III subunit gamma/tau [Acidobacteriota bacterium]